MEGENETAVTEFILIGYAGRPKIRIGLIVFLTIAYCVTVVGNSLIILLVAADPRLHNPMYFFLGNLSLIDIGHSSAVIPQSITNLLVDKPTLTFARCYLQMSSSVWLSITECFLLAIMAYDRFIAISSPLHYMLIMSKRLCIQLATGIWTCSMLLGVIPIYAIPARFCGKSVIDHFACELIAVLKLVCSDTSLSQLLMFFSSCLSLLVPFAFILFSYLRIIVTILRIHSTNGRFKAFSTCASHLTVVLIYFGTAIFAYVKPQTKSTMEIDKSISLVYGIVTPMLNPLIYTLRNKDIKEALRKFVGKQNICVYV
nr:olfactory receptor 13H1-like [Anolis sagrei ordinatus]